MADPLWGQQMTNMWMLDPTMFDPTQKSNQYSPFNGAALPFPPTYNTGPAGGPTNAMGQPIASFQQWQAANPAGTTINQTPAQPQVQSSSPNFAQGVYSPNYLSSLPQATQQALQSRQSVPLSALSGGVGGGSDAAGLGMLLGMPSSAFDLPGQAAAPQAAPQAASQAPNNWYAALNALSNPGNPVTKGATVPQAQGYQPAGGVNQAFLNQAGAGMNQNFMSALAAIQGRPQSGQQRKTG